MADQITPPIIQTMQQMPIADHDLIIEVRTDVRNLNTTISNYMLNTGKLAQDHEDRLRDHQTKIDQLEGGLRTFKGFIAILGVIFSAMLVAIGWYAAVHH